MSRMPKWGRLLAWTLLAVLALAGLLVAGAWWTVRQSVPALDGQLRLAGLAAPLAVRRDALGTAVIAGANRLDVARALGFVHAQERFFEMDLTRRSAAGELSELFGAAALERDRKRRLHRLRAVLAERFTRMDGGERALLAAYADGVNAGLAQLGARPWQYLLLQTQPRAWEPVDSLLVVAEMFWRLQGDSVDAGLERALLRQRVGDDLFDWLEPQGGRWDAALDGSVMAAPPLPAPARFDLRKGAAAATPGAAPGVADAGAGVLAALDGADRHGPPVGSNNWAITAARSVTGDAMLADDMHLGLSAPSIWFRAQFEIGSGAGAVRAAGLTLPGLPALVAGSNGQVAWGFTNAYGQWFEWSEVPHDADPARTTHVAETIAVKGGAAVALDVLQFDGLPVAAQRDGHAYALHWIADVGDAYNLALDDMLAARGVDSARAVAQRAGMPQQNILIADRRGCIAWTIAGRLWEGSGPQQFGRFAPPGRRAPAWLAAASAPYGENPPGGQLWTANARQLGGAGAMPLAPGAAPAAPPCADGGPPPLPVLQAGAPIGNGGFDIGARAQQIRDRLSATPRFDEAALGAIQFDDEARFLRPWADRIAAVAVGTTARPAVGALLKAWNGRADADQAAYRLVRGVRMHVLDALWLAWTRPLLGDAQANPQRRLEWHAMFEYSAEQALDRRPPHLLPRAYASWDAFMLAQVDATVAEMTRNGQRPLAQATWGEANASQVRNVMSRALPLLSPLLDMPSLPQAGDNNMPHVAGPAFGQSQRLVVAPGHEERATLSMPGGQSGHPLSPYYGAGHDAWAAGRPTPLLAGPAQHVLALVP